MGKTDCGCMAGLTPAGECNNGAHCPRAMEGITRSGSFGPAAELAAAHTEIERLKAWSNEQIAKLNARIAELELALELQKRIAGGFSQALMAAEAEGPDHGEADPDYPPHRYLFEGEPEHCSLCGEAGHTHDDHYAPLWEGARRGAGGQDREAAGAPRAMSDEPRQPWVKWRSLPVCASCWNERNPDRQAVHLMDWSEEECIVCEEKTTSGIFVRVRVEWR